MALDVALVELALDGGHQVGLHLDGDVLRKDRDEEPFQLLVLDLQPGGNAVACVRKTLRWVFSISM